MGAFGWKKGVWLRCQVGHSKYLQKGLLLNQNEMSVAQALNGLLIAANFYVQCEHSLLMKFLLTPRLPVFNKMS